MKHAILRMADALGKGDFDTINSVFRDAQKYGADRDIGMFYEDINIVENRLISDQRTGLIETEWGVINELIDGGFGAGDLVVLIGSAGSGKSWMLSSIGANALKVGKSVLHITLELSESYTSKRYDSRLTSIVSSNLKYHVDDVKEAISQAKGKLTIKFYPTKSITVHTIRGLIERATLLGRKPDLVIVDYGDLIKSDNAAAIKGGSYNESGGIYEDLRGLAGEFGVPFITASQSNRSASEKDIITGEDVAESFKKIMIADVVISLSRKTDDKIQSTGRVHVIKNRYGPDGITFPSNINANIGQIIIHSPTSIEGKQTKKSMENSNEVIRKKLADKYQDYES
jgi:replicative DNA helicase